MVKHLSRLTVDPEIDERRPCSTHLPWLITACPEVSGHLATTGHQLRVATDDTRHITCLMFLLENRMP